MKQKLWFSEWERMLKLWMVNDFGHCRRKQTVQLLCLQSRLFNVQSIKHESFGCYVLKASKCLILLMRRYDSPNSLPTHSLVITKFIFIFIWHLLYHQSRNVCQMFVCLFGFVLFFIRRQLHANVKPSIELALISREKFFGRKSQ